jgi:PIN domain nuclease of toxin-antitoxin system
MAGRKKPVVYLDTHVVAWLYDALVDKLSAKARAVIDANELHISWMVKLELQYLYEIGRIRVRPDPVVDELRDSIGLRMSEISMERVAEAALRTAWTRDVFDRLITAESQVTGFGLVTKDASIRKNFKLAIW